ncbi:hypothetical protein A4V01_09590 [Erysipelotrichaceae bacterium I46]|nr:hypothetical protein A4V01_09590 [Erysipelotrichaceae bacterium I46]ASU18412.1 hypothetical protein ADH65_07695 [[Clostridium] innocuum]
MIDTSLMTFMGVEERPKQHSHCVGIACFISEPLTCRGLWMIPDRMNTFCSGKKLFAKAMRSLPACWLNIRLKHLQRR